MQWAGEIKRAKTELEGKNLARARRICERVLVNEPGQPDALEILATAEMRRLRFSEAAQQFRKLLNDDPERCEAWAKMGFCLQNLRQPEEALKAYDKALKKLPDHYETLFASAFLLIALGKTGEAKKRLEKAVAVVPQQFAAYRLLSSLRHFKKRDPFLKKMEAMVGEAENAPPDERAQLFYALAAAYGQLGDNQKFMDAVETANRLQRKIAPKWEQATRLMAEMSKQVFTPELFERRKGDAAKTLTPVFIVGLPRSGSTLAEQIIASHSQAFGADELTLVRDLFVDSHPTLTGAPYPRKVASLSNEVLDELAEKYQARVKAIAPGYDYVCDKQVGNALYVGMIRYVMPWAKVIHVRRHPYDTALSVYRNYFHPSIAYAADLRGLASYFRITHELIEHWRQVAPGFVLDVRYEDLVKNLEKETRKILKFVGLPFEEACLEFHKTKRAVFTHSALQVRTKLDSSGIGRWKEHTDMLSPFINEAKDLLKSYGY